MYDIVECECGRPSQLQIIESMLFHKNKYIYTHFQTYDIVMVGVSSKRGVSNEWAQKKESKWATCQDCDVVIWMFLSYRLGQTKQKKKIAHKGRKQWTQKGYFCDSYVQVTKFFVGMQCVNNILIEQMSRLICFCFCRSFTVSFQCTTECVCVSFVYYFFGKFLKVYIFFVYYSPRSRLTSCISLTIIVTRLAWIAQRFVSSNKPTRYASAACWRARRAILWKRTTWNKRNQVITS